MPDRVAAERAIPSIIKSLERMGEHHEAGLRIVEAGQGRHWRAAIAQIEHGRCPAAARCHAIVGVAPRVRIDLAIKDDASEMPGKFPQIARNQHGCRI